MSKIWKYEGSELRKIIESEQEGETAPKQRLSLVGAQVCDRPHWEGLGYLPEQDNVPLQANGSQQRF